MARGNADIRNFANKENIVKYLSQFIDVKFRGNKMIIKWIKKKILENIIKEAIEELPKLKVTARKLWSENKDEILGKVKEAIKKEIFELAEKV